jgi:hypothetical protein
MHAYAQQEIAERVGNHGKANKHLIFQLAAATVDRGRVPFRG